MNDSPGSLQSICIDFITNNINSVFFCVNDENGNTLRYVFKDGSISLPISISELFLKALDGKCMTDALLSIFNSSATRLRHICIRNGQELTTKSLKILKDHKISEIIAMKLAGATVNDLIGCLSDWTLQNLRQLNVSQSTFGNCEKVLVVIALSKLKNLRCLDVSFTEFNNQGLEIITSDLPCLESLNIAGTRVSDLSPLRNCKSPLHSLNLHNIKYISSKESIKTLSKMHSLQCLDISVDKEDINFNSENNATVKDIFEMLDNMPLLISLDLSGIQNIDIQFIKHFVATHKNLQFLGLMENAACQDDMFYRLSDPMYNPKLVVTGNATEKQILESLRRYILRKLYVVKSLCALYADLNCHDARVDIIELVLESMKTYPKVLGIQMAATACLYNLTKGVLSTRIHPNRLRKVVDCTLLSMENFPNQLQLQKNALLTLCSDRMLQDVSFNRYHCAELVMNSLMSFNDPAMNRMSVAICSILAARISTVETSHLGAKTHYMIRLLDIVKEKKRSGGHRHHDEIHTECTLELDR